MASDDYPEEPAPGPLVRRFSSISQSKPQASHDNSGSTQIRPELVGDAEWTEWNTLERRQELKTKIADEKRELSLAQFREAYQAAIHDCVYDASSRDPTILHYIIRVVEVKSFKHSKPLHYLVEVSVDELAARLETDPLGDSLHEAIKSNHFDIVKCICSKGEEAKLKDPVADAIAVRSNNSGQNCLHAAIAADPRYIDVVDDLITYAPKKAFEATRTSDGNTPLHDFVEFKGNRLLICKCKCKQCVSLFPRDVTDENEYTLRFMKTLRNLISAYPDALSTPNIKGKTPYVVHRESRKEVITHEPWDDIEYHSSEDGQQAVSSGANDQQHAPALASSDTTSNVNGESISAPVQLKEMNGILGSTTATQQRPERLKKNSSTDMGRFISRSADSHHVPWIRSKHLATEVSRHLLEACCSRPSWDKAVKSLFGDRQLGDESKLHSSFKTDDALYKDIEKDYDFLSLNSILAHVELSLTSPCPDVGLDLDDMTSPELGVDEIHEAAQKELTPEMARNKNVDYLNAVFRWLETKGVKRILRLKIVDNQELQCSDDTIEECLKGWDIRYLDWNKRDLSIETIKNGQAANMVELWLSWSGQNTVLLGWSDPEFGLKKQLTELQRVHVEVHSSVESPQKMTAYLNTFKERIGSRDKLKFDIPQDLRAAAEVTRRGVRGSNLEEENQIHHKWMEAVWEFRKEIIRCYTKLPPNSPLKKTLDKNAVKVALIDDGVNPSKLHAKGSLKNGWPTDGFAGDRTVNTYWTSSNGHGTTMANLIHYACPFVHLYVAKLEKSPPKPYSSVAHMATEAVKWAVSNKVDAISMSWTIKSDVSNRQDEIDLANQITIAEQTGIILFRSSEDGGQHGSDPGHLLPAQSQLLKRIGSCNKNGSVSDFVNKGHVHYLFPGEQLSVMQPHLESPGGTKTSTDQGSSASTALASGLASLVLWCTIYSGDKKKRFTNKRMYALFDKLRTDPVNTSLVDVTRLMDDVRARGQDAHKIVTMFVQRLREKIPDEMRQYEEEEAHMGQRRADK